MTALTGCLETTAREYSVGSRANGMDVAAEEKRRAFEEEALPHLDTVYRVALRLAGDAMRAEDLAQETMLKAYRAWHRYERGTNARAWLLTILRNSFINEYRRRQPEAHASDFHELQEFLVFEDIQEVNPESGFFNELVDEGVVRALEALPPLFREAVILSDLEGMSYAEISGITGVPIGTVKSRLFRGRRRLRDDLYAYALEMGYIRAESSGGSSQCRLS